jgi:predicted DNA-binding transcriptional regulator YafY
MRRSDRLLGLLLQLSDREAISATRLAGHFEVSVRTVYRDIDALAELGIPVYAETGRNGGFRLVEGYRLPPVMFTEGEAISLILGVALLASLPTRPHATDLVSAEGKLRAALPATLQQTLREARRLIGFEKAAATAFHIEHAQLKLPDASPERENHLLEQFLAAVLHGRTVRLRYQSPYWNDGPRNHEARPTGLFWDQNFWYLTGTLSDGRQRIWRADRVLELTTTGASDALPRSADISAYLNRAWLAAAMRDWAEECPVRILITPAQAERLAGDWYYQHARYETRDDGRILMTFGQDRPDIVRELVRWLGPGAELIDPPEWRELIMRDLREMLATYEEGVGRP